MVILTFPISAATRAVFICATFDRSNVHKCIAYEALLSMNSRPDWLRKWEFFLVECNAYGVFLADLTYWPILRSNPSHTIASNLCTELNHRTTNPGLQLPFHNSCHRYYCC